MAHDPRLANALSLIREKQDAAGRWPLEYNYTGKTWVDFGPKKAAQQVGHAARLTGIEGSWVASLRSLAASVPV